MDIDQLLKSWQADPEFAQNITCWNITPALEAKFADFPSDLHPGLIKSLHSQNINQLFSHQAEAFSRISEGANVVLATGTASGKTLSYDLPVLNYLLKTPGSTALYLFPTKALAQDQLRTLFTLTDGLVGSTQLFSAIYDGDTPSHARSEARSKAPIIISNPDMLHQGILPHHTLWHKFLRGLRFVVVDEMHTYRGVFGSHIANVFRRLKRIAAFYGSYPQFILTSATIGNPLELARNLIESPVVLIDQDGSSHGERHFLVYNPPMVDQQLGLRKSSLQSGITFTQKLLAGGHQTLVFARTRRTVEMILTYMRDQMPLTDHSLVRGYRSGYLKSDRREIETGLKIGTVKAVVATSALELGIDIGDLESVILVGYPGSIATTRQRAGRAGRRKQSSLAILVATPDAMDQYLANHASYLTDHNPEEALIDANNLSILLQHLRCAAFELPFNTDDSFGNLRQDMLRAFLEMLTASGQLNRQGNKFFWVADQYPAGSVSLRSTTPDVVTLTTKTEAGPKVIGEIDAGSASWLVHPEAIYLHEADTFLVKSLDLEKGKCELEPVQSEYYTLPDLETSIEEFHCQQEEPFANYSKSFGDLTLRMEIVSYRKLHWLTNETIGHGQVTLIPHFLSTMGCWLSLEPVLVNQLRTDELWNAEKNNYGSGWAKLRQKILARDGFQCRSCGKKLEPAQLHVHHIQPFKTFVNPEQANNSTNLITLCPSCHIDAERNVRVRSGLAGASNALRNLAPLMVMCDREDLGMLSEPRSVLSGGKPTILVYDSIPGGLGLSQKLYENHLAWIMSAWQMIAECPCQEGCPACVGPVGEAGFGGKAEALALLGGMA